MAMRYALIALAGWAMPAGAADPAPALPGWMAGCWEHIDGDSWAEECWTVPRGGMMLGSSRTGVGDTIRSWEAMQIILDRPREDGSAAGMAFWASPNGANRTRFDWKPGEAPGVAFHNVANDYPQRVRYWREGDALMAEIAMADGGKPMRWTFKRK